MPNLAKVTVIGHCGAKIYINPARTVASFDLAHNWKEKSINKTQWFRVSVFGNRIDWLEKDFRQGAAVHVSGDFRSGEYDKKDGTKGFKMEIVFAEVTFLSRDNAPEKQEVTANTVDGFDSDIPF